jgi:hypothetical protein
VRASGTGRPMPTGVAVTKSTAEVTVSGASTSKVAAAVRAARGHVVAAVPGQVTAVVPKASVAALAAAPAVADVTRPVRAFPQSGPVSEGVVASNAGPASTAGTWQAAGQTGSGVDVGIVDAGFAGLATAVAAGDLPAGLTVAGNHCANVNGTAHGTAVTEIVHQMAPAATVHLYCVDTNIGFAQSETELQGAGVTIVNSSLGFPGDARGDGTGASTSTAATVQKARKAGILWIQSAGNSAADHWSGTLADADRDGAVDLDGTSDDRNFDAVTVPGTAAAGSAGGSAGLLLQWDQWPTSTASFELAVFGEQCNNASCSSRTNLNGGNAYLVEHTSGTAPVLEYDVHNTSTYPQNWYIYALVGSGFPKVKYSLFEEGDVSSSYLSSLNASRAASGSVESPASSPYALAVGAADVGADGGTQGALEDFSSRGPTIDGRVKPDITGWDGVSSPVYGAVTPSGGGFYGTSASAPHVAGAAALVKAANPELDAAQIQAFLERRAGHGTANNPPLNSSGHGLLTLGAPSDIIGPAGARYTAITPTRILDTRTTTGGHHARVGAGATVTIPVPGLPADATAVAINLTGIGASTSTHLTAYPGGTDFPGTSNLNLSTIDSTAAVFAIVSVGPARTITVQNSSGTVDIAIDEVGYFGTVATTGKYTPLAAPKRVLDTRTTTGGHHAKLGNKGTVLVNPATPASSIAAVVNLTATSTTTGGHLTAAPTCTGAVSTLNYAKYTRANLAVVGLTGSTPGFCVENSGPAADVIVDVVGYLGDSGSDYYALPAPKRIIDTRTGNGGSAGQHSSKPFAAASTTAFYGANVGDVPADASALFTGVVEAQNTAGGYLSLFPGSTRPSSLTSSLNFTTGRVVANAGVVGLSGNQFAVYNYAGSVHAAVDLFGYFRAG